MKDSRGNISLGDCIRFYNVPDDRAYYLAEVLKGVRNARLLRGACALFLVESYRIGPLLIKKKK